MRRSLVAAVHHPGEIRLGEGADEGGRAVQSGVDEHDAFATVYAGLIVSDLHFNVVEDERLHIAQEHELAGAALHVAQQDVAQGTLRQSHALHQLAAVLNDDIADRDGAEVGKWNIRG